MKLLLFAIPLLAAAQQGAVEGVAYNKVTKAPVEGVRVTIAVRGDSGNYREAVTGPGGKYRVDNLAAGEYSPNVGAPPGFYGPPILELAHQRFRISDRVVQFDIPLIPASIARGRILDPDRRPVARAQLTAIPIGGLMSGRAATDSEGRFSMHLAPGKYYLRVQPASNDYLPTYYPSAAAMDSAEAIVLREGAGVDGLDIRVRPAGGRKLSGIVRDEDGKPAAGVELSIQETGAYTSTSIKTASDAKGVFTFSRVPPGAWQITAAAFRDGVRRLGRALFTMADHDLDGVEVRIDSPFTYEVRLEGAPSDRRSALRIELRLTAVVGPTPFSQEQSGAAHLEGVYPGAYRVGTFGVVPGRYLKSVLLGDADVTGRPFDLTAGSPPLRLVYAEHPGRLTGEVEDGAGAKVILVSADRDNYISGTDTVTIICDAGRFTSPELRPGSWYALAYTRMPDFGDGLIRDRLFNGGLWRQAATFRVAEGETATIKLKASPWPE